MKLILYTEDWETQAPDREIVENCDYTAIETKNGSRFIIYDFEDCIEIVAMGKIALYPSDSSRVIIKTERT